MAMDRRERRQRYRALYPERYRDLRRASAQRRRHRQREMVFDHYGRSCACCGAGEPLTIDHVNGDGAEHRRAMGNSGGTHFYHWLVVNGFPPGFQSLCGPCNQSKGRGPACRLSHNASETGAATTPPAGLWTAFQGGSRMSDETIPAGAVIALLRRILGALDVGDVVTLPARAGYVVRALRQLLDGPAPSAATVEAATAFLSGHVAPAPSGPAAASTAPPARDPANGPYATREEAEAAFADLARGAESGTLGTRTQFLAASVIDTIDNFAETGAYDQQLAGRLASLLGAADIGVIASWVRRAAHDRPDPDVYVVNPGLDVPGEGR